MTRYPQGPADSPGFLLWHVSLRWQRAVTAALAPLDLTHVQFVLLACAWWLCDQGGTPNQAELARQAGTDVKMTSQVVRTLAARGLIRRRVAARDARAMTVRPTARGTALAVRTIAVVEQADREFFAPTSTAPLVRTLTRLARREPGDEPKTAPAAKGPGPQPPPGAAPARPAGRSIR